MSRLKMSKKIKNISKALRRGLFLLFAYVLMHRYRGLPYFIVHKNEQKLKKNIYHLTENSLKISLKQIEIAV